jgi:sulfhydrogenase subunit beta (sulfur reductase)
MDDAGHHARLGPPPGGRLVATTELTWLLAEDIEAMLARLVRETRVLAPMRRGRASHAFEWVSDPGQVTLDYVRTILPPKRALLPYRDTLLSFTRQPVAHAQPALDCEPSVVFGIHACDLYAITELDWAYLKRHQWCDQHYWARREALTIVGVECLPDEFCFCTPLGLDASRRGADLFLIPVQSGYVAEVLTDKGRRLLAGLPDLRWPTETEMRECRQWSQDKRSRTRLKLAGNVREYPDLLERRYDSAAWAETARRCYSCGTCTNVCPTCICFDIGDEVDLALRSGRRWRQYDSCQFWDFALVAGPHNFRPERPDRVRHRWFRKWVYLNREYGFPFCVGCGRCTQECKADISWVDVLNTVVAEAIGGAG